MLPHALIELIALFLPLAAWIIASRRGEWEQLLAATVVTVAIAVPMLVVAALIEVYVSPHLFTALTHIHPPIVAAPRLDVTVRRVARRRASVLGKRRVLGGDRPGQPLLHFV